MRKTCAARLDHGERCDQPSALPDRELRDLVCPACARRLDLRRWHRAYYAAGRAIALNRLGVPVAAVSLHAPGMLRTQASPAHWDLLSATDRCLYFLAGGVAEDYGVAQAGIGKLAPAIGDLDVAYARCYARSLVHEEGAAAAYLEVARQDAIRMVADHRTAVEGVATALFERLRLNAEETAAILALGKEAF